VYKKLLSFLERVLDEEGIPTGAATTTPQKSASKKRTANGEIKPGAVEDTTPSRKSTTSNSFVGRIKSSTATRTAGSQGDVEAPKYTMPSIRTLCRTFSTPLLAPHVYTGTCVVLKMARLWPQDEEDDPETAVGRWKGTPRGSSFDEVVMGLLIALYLMTLTKMQSAKMTTTVYKATCNKGVEVLGYKPGAAGVEEWIRTINRDGYCRGQDWWDSVPDSVFDYDPNSNNEQEDIDIDDDDDDEPLTGRSSRRRLASSTRQKEAQQEDDPEGVLLPGLATMMQDAYDLLSEDRQRDFSVWKKSFLQRLDKLDRPTARPSGGRAVAAK